jgi:hypothetical protein
MAYFYSVDGKNFSEFLLKQKLEMRITDGEDWSNEICSGESCILHDFSKILAPNQATEIIVEIEND